MISSYLISYSARVQMPVGRCHDVTARALQVRRRRASAGVRRRAGPTRRGLRDRYRTHPRAGDELVGRRLAGMCDGALRSARRSGWRVTTSSTPRASCQVEAVENLEIQKTQNASRRGVPARHGGPGTGGPGARHGVCARVPPSRGFPIAARWGPGRGRADWQAAEPGVSAGCPEQWNRAWHWQRPGGTPAAEP
jgi:hypothetical protein